jgi:hypothetical protein
VYFLHRSGPARDERQPLNKATLDVAWNKQTTDGVPNNSTAHRFTSSDDGLRIPASYENIEVGHEFPPQDVRLEMGSNDGDCEAYYEKGDEGFFRLLLQLFSTLKNATHFLFRLFSWN